MASNSIDGLCEELHESYDAAGWLCVSNRRRVGQEWRRYFESSLRSRAMVAPDTDMVNHGVNAYTKGIPRHGTPSAGWKSAGIGHGCGLWQCARSEERGVLFA